MIHWKEENSNLHKSSKHAEWIVSGIEFIAMFVGKPESEHSIQHGEHVRNQKTIEKKR